MKKLTLSTTVVLLALLAGCASTSATRQTSASNCDVPTSKEESISLALIEQQVLEKQYYSALAYLEKASDTNPRVLRLRAEAQRNTGMLSEAYASYRDLSLTCLTAYGHAGMAKILATRGDLPQAHQQMLKARRLAPSNADIRNDYGFILLAHKNFKEAQREFMTALQLQPGHPVAIRNMVISLILDGDSRTAVRMAKNNGIDSSEFKFLLSQANAFKQPALAGSNNIYHGAPL
ncbi:MULTISPECIES: tetratricopeptide repeat protein [Zhongshania]|jgi:Flp pilus assembly protein TadD|uniref:Flp pilus assembly protein TadD n=1 Tax=Zhongshania antarctica TaxID=641702 RepID=A0A840R3G7_9GAMM|nr:MULTISPECIES: tetratricopeptide repeat protein [Zhongshania]MBB5187337.1 Flp pilus assembly protein TadD [Zhongshania antarctica]